MKSIVSHYGEIYFVTITNSNYKESNPGCIWEMIGMGAQEDQAVGAAAEELLQCQTALNLLPQNRVHDLLLSSFPGYATSASATFTSFLTLPCQNTSYINLSQKGSGGLSDTPFLSAHTLLYILT